MQSEPALADYLELRLGAALDPQDVQTMLTDDLAAGETCVCVDWIAVDDRLFMLSLRPGQSPQCTPLTISQSTVRNFVTTALA